MLSEPKMQIFQDEINFFRMIFKDRQYTSSPHIAAELDHFLNSNLLKKQVQ